MTARIRTGRPYETLPGAPFPDVAEHSPDALLIISAGGAITYLNAAAETLFGYRRE